MRITRGSSLASNIATVRGVRFTGVVFPGETLRTAAWRDGDRFLVTTTVPDRDNAPALSDAELVLA